LHCAGSTPEEDPMTWGTQIGGIQATDDLTRTEFKLDACHLDHRDRVEEFGRRHGGLAPNATRAEQLEGGYRGWSEVHAADGYVLRIEWSRTELRSTLQVFELAPSL
jgi:hypothetical protein